mgnify:CR=1 FL=1
MTFTENQAQKETMFLTLEEIAAVLRISTESVRRLYRNKRIPVIRLGHRTIRFNPDEVIYALSNQDEYAAAMSECKRLVEQAHG